MMDEAVARAVLSAYPRRKMSAADAAAVVKAWAGASWPMDRWGNYKVTDEKRVKIAKRVVRTEDKFGSEWRIKKSTPIIEAALNLVKKASALLGETSVTEKVGEAKTARRGAAAARAEKAKEERLREEVMAMVAKVASAEMPAEFAVFHDKGDAGREFAERWTQLVRQVQGLRRIGKAPRDQELFSTFHPPLAPLLMAVTAEWVETIRGEPYTVTVRPGGPNQAVIEIGSNRGETGFGSRVDPISMGIYMGGPDINRKGDAYLSGRISRGKEGAFGALFYIASTEKQRGAGGRVLDLWCNLMDSYGAMAWVGEGIGPEGMAFLDAKVRSGRLEKIGGEGANIVLRCLGGPEGKQPLLPGISLQANAAEYEWNADEALRELKERASEDGVILRLPPDDAKNPLYNLWLSYGRPRYYEPRMMGSYARSYATSMYAWAVPGDDVLERIAKLSPILEVGAGRGYWAKLIADQGADIIATDPYPPEGAYYPIEKLSAVDAVKKYGRGRTLLSIWPPYRDSMALDALRAFEDVGGTSLVYIGEGGYGCTADAAFHQALGLQKYEEDEEPEPEEQRGWELVDADYDMPSWDGYHDSYRHFERTGVTKNPKLV